jgi:hypothetical protein
MPDGIKDEEFTRQESVSDHPVNGVYDNLEPLKPGSDGRIHPVEVWEEYVEIQGTYGKYKVKATRARFQTAQ